MTSCDLTEVGVRLEEVVQRVADDSYTPLLLYQCYEMTAIGILDSEAHLYDEGVLTAYLTGYLSAKLRELGVDPCDLD